MTIEFKEMAFNCIEDGGINHTEEIPIYLADTKRELTLLLLGMENTWKEPAGEMLCKVKEDNETYMFNPLNRIWEIADYENINEQI